MLSFWKKDSELYIMSMFQYFLELETSSQQNPKTFTSNSGSYLAGMSQIGFLLCFLVFS